MRIGRIGAKLLAAIAVMIAVAVLECQLQIADCRLQIGRRAEPIRLRIANCGHPERSRRGLQIERQAEPMGVPVEIGRTPAEAARPPPEGGVNIPD